MQETITTTPDDELPPSRPRRFRLIALGLALLLFAPFAYVAYQNIADAVSDPSPGPNPGLPEPDFSLTDEEAVGTFERLLEQAHLSSETRDSTILPQIFTQSSPMKERAEEVIQRLKQDQVLDQSQYESLSIEVLSNDATEITVKEHVQVKPCFRSESGKDVTQGNAEVEYETVWTMRLEDSTWLLHDSRASNDKVTDSGKASC